MLSPEDAGQVRPTDQLPSCVFVDIDVAAIGIVVVLILLHIYTRKALSSYVLC